MSIEKKIFLVIGQKDASNDVSYHTLQLQNIETVEEIYNSKTGNTPLIGVNFHAAIENVNRVEDTADIVLTKMTKSGPVTVRRTLKMNQTESIHFPGTNIVIQCGISTFDLPNVFNTEEDAKQMYEDATAKVGMLINEEITLVRKQESEPGLE